MKFEMAGPMANQLKACLSSVMPWARRPTWRCKAITAAPVAPPVNKALMHSTGKVGQITAKPVPTLPSTTLQPTGRLRPWRSA